jgi:ribosomal protein L11 methyltransferase
VQLDVSVDEAELAADALWQAEPSAVLEVDLGGGRVRLTADVARPAEIDASWRPAVLEIDDDGYLDAWRTWAAPIRAGRHLVLHPAWLPREPEDPAGSEDLVLVLDPGRAFGSGSHESTRLAAALLEDEVVRGDAVLDVGCGSGVLSVAAVRLGAATAVAIDIEAAAVAATRANAAANGVGERVAASTGAVADVAGTFDLVVANIGGSVLFELASDLAGRARPGGRLVLAGILAERADALVAALPGCVERRRMEEGGWVGLALSRAAT